METFKILKYRTPYSIFEEFDLKSNNKLYQHTKKLKVSEHNFFCKSPVIWNALIDKILEKNSLSDKGYIIPGSKINSDLAASISFD